MENVDVDSLLGLLKLVLDFGGRAPLSDLAKSLHLTLDELYHVLDAAANLGALKVQDGQVALTRRGLELLRMRFGDIHHMLKLRIEELQ
ncbi:MAG: AAA-associated domain-containing protein [Thermoproteus sp.]